MSVGRYEIREMLGAGAMGVVYRAHDPDLARTIAIKLVRDDGANLSRHLRLMREAQAMARLRHPNVVPIFDVGQAGGAVFVAMPLLEGGTLTSWLCAGPRPVAAILDRFIAAGRGLAAAHAAGLVHRDFKPDNVLLGTDGEIHVADFGLARLVHDDLTPAPGAIRLASIRMSQTGAVVGTPAYMAPEQLRGLPIDERADQFSFCVSLWEALYGERPFPNPRPGQPLRARLEVIAAGPVRPPPHPGLPAWLGEVLARGLASEPDQRWPSIQALLDAIAAHRAPRRWPRGLAAGLGAAGLIAAISTFARPAPVAPELTPDPLIRDGDLKASAVSPDGIKLAFIRGDSLVIRETKIGARDHTVVEHGVDGPIAWSPDNRHLLVGTVPDLAPVIQTELVDIEGGVQFKLPMTGFAAFLSSTEVAITSHRRRTIDIFRLGEHASPTATCPVPGQYKFLLDLAGSPDGTMVIETEAQGSDHHGLVILGRDCELQATYEGEQISGFALTDTGTIVALVPHDGPDDEILEISRRGVPISRRAVKGVLGKVLGRRQGTDYVTTLAPRTDLVRVHVQDGSSQPLLSIDGNASFRLAPDGEAVAWVERDRHGQSPGQLWLSTLEDMTRSQALRHDALSADWSPDGQSLAVLVDGGDKAWPTSAQRRSTTSLAIIDRSGQELRRIRLDHVDRVAAPVWLDDHRIAVRTDDHSTYRQLDLDAGGPAEIDRGELIDSEHGATCLLTRSPYDGTLAMWRNGPPGAIDAHTEHLWLLRGHAVRALHVEDAIRHFLAPSWLPSGELLVRAPDGVISRVTLDTGELTPITKLLAQQLSFRYDDHVIPLTGGDLLAVNHELGTSVAVIRPER